MAAAPPPALAAAAAEGEEEEEDQCRICRCPAEADRPLRHPCACSGSIKFVHDDCLLRWLATRRRSSSRCEVCNRDISVRPLYAAGAPARLPVSEFVAGAAHKLLGWVVLLLSFVFAMCVWEFVMPLTTVWTWRLALARSSAQVRHLISLRFSATTLLADGLYGVRFMPSADAIFACVSLRRAFLRELAHFRQLDGAPRVAADAIAPFALWVARLETRLQHRVGALDSLQILALHTVEASLMVVIGDVVLAFVFGFLPFSLGRIILRCISVFNFCDLDKAHSTSTASILLIGYGCIFSLGVLFTGQHTFLQHSRGERLTIAVLFKDFTNGIYWLVSPFRRLPGIHVMVLRSFSLLQQFFRGVIFSITVANICLNLVNTFVICPLFFGWLLDICTSNLFGSTISQKIKLISASSFASTALHWLIGCICLNLQLKISSLLRAVLRPGVNIPFVHAAENGNAIRSFRKPFYEVSFKILPILFVGAIYVAMVILVPVQIASQLAPEVFPLDIISFKPPSQSTSFWHAPRNYAELLSATVLLRFLLRNTFKYLGPGALAKKVLRCWFATTGHVLGLPDLLNVRPDGASVCEVGSSVASKDQNVCPDEAKGKRKFGAVRLMLLVVLAWLTIVIFNTSVLIVPISVGRALLFAIPQLPVAGVLKSNDLFALAVGFGIISTIIASTRDSFAYITSGRTHLLASIICKWGVIALNSSPLLFIWIVIIPLLIGLLVGFLLISPFTASASDGPVLDFFCTWFLGLLLLKFWTKLAHWTRAAPFLAYFIDERWEQKLTRAREDGLSGLRAMWVLQDVLMPITTKLLAALGFPYVLAKVVFPSFGYSAAVNSAVYRFAWLGSLAFIVLCHLAKGFCSVLVKLHDSIRDERYLIGQRLQNYADGDNS